MEWSEIVLIVLAVVLLVAGGYIKRLINEIHELVGAVNTLLIAVKHSIEDLKITPEELADVLAKVQPVIKEAKDVRAITLEIVRLMLGKK